MTGKFVEFAKMVAEADSDNFYNLVRLAQLDPAKDFVNANLSEVDFFGSDLGSFDFTRADLRRVDWDRCANWPTQCRFALLGKGNATITADDFERLVQLVKEAPTWSERFFAFATIVENFGESYLVFDLMNEIVEQDKSTYQKVCCFVYFAASYIRHEEAKRYCLLVAEQSNARTNMFRIDKVKRYARELRKFLAETDSFSQRFPGEVDQRRIPKAYSNFDMH